MWYAFVPNFISNENRKLLLEFFAVSNIVKLTSVEELRGNKNALVINTAQKLNLIVVWLILYENTMSSFCNNLHPVHRDCSPLQVCETHEMPKMYEN